MHKCKYCSYDFSLDFYACHEHEKICEKHPDKVAKKHEEEKRKLEIQIDQMKKKLESYNIESFKNQNALTKFQQELH